MKASAIALLTAFACTAAFADEMRLRDGTVLEGTLVGASARLLHVRTAAGVRHLPVSEVESVAFEPRVPTAPDGDRPDADPSPARIVGTGPAQAIQREDGAP